jgi:ketosteroid isomerase-like protein
VCGVTDEGADLTSVAARFNRCVNARDLDGLADLMTDDHTFIDSAGSTLAGKAACLTAWRAFFDGFPDYRNTFTSLTAADGVVTIVGYSECADPSLAGPARWTATIRDGKVAAWHVRADTPETRRRLPHG